jgi:regulation of enolase protein 1 (concanavalin A-like superfamily)
MKSLRQGGALSAIVFACALVSVQSTFAQTALPSGWTSQDIGTTGGSASITNGTWTVSGSGANIWDAADAFQFTYRSVSGDFDIAARLTALNEVNGWSKAGLMVRESLAANARNAYVMFANEIGLALQYRAATGGTTTRVAGPYVGEPIWLRLVRQGTRFTAYSSPNGTTWTAMGSTTLSMGTSVYVGMAVTSRDPAAVVSATFTNVALEQSAEAPATTTWAGADVGAPAIAGTSSESAGTYMVSGAGTAVWGTADQFRYMYQQADGDVEIIARIASLQAPSAGSKAGVMIRQSLDSGSKHAFMILTGKYGYTFQRRIATGGESSNTDGPDGVAPGWVRLVREGNLFSAYQSANGSTWTLIGTDTIAMTGTVDVGLVVNSGASTATATASFTNVTVRTPNAGANQPPSVTLTAPTSGAAYTAPATLSFSASASDADGSISRVDFYRGATLVQSDTTSPYTATWSSAPAGTYSLTAVAVDNEGASTTSTAVSVTVNGTSGQAPSVSFTRPSQSASFTAPGDVYIEVAASDPDGTISRVEIRQGTTLLKSDTTTPYSFRWRNVPAGSYQLNATAYDNSGASRTATIGISVTGPGNQLPTVSITSPANGMTYTAPASVTINASASDPDGTISRVEFYRGSTLIATDTTSPYSASWTSAPAGSYALTARAYDSAGGAQTSAAVNISIGSASNQLPAVSITSPATGASFTAPASVTIAATATDTDGTIAGVDFYVGSQLVASDTSSPYTASWTNVAAGTYSLTAVARDNSGGTRTSTAVSVTVNASGTLPTSVAFNASPDHTALVTSYAVAIYRSVDPVTASPVATRDLGKPTPVSGVITVDISTLVNPLATGSYYAVVRAIGVAGSTASAPSATFSK